MASCFIRAIPKARGGESYQVRFRMGGRSTPLLTAGTFPSLEQAERRADDIRHRIAAGTIKPEKYRRRASRKSAGTSSVYIARAANGGVLYVGVTSRNLRRLHSHSQSAAWWAKATAISLEHFKTRREAEQRERELIAELQPAFNVTHIAAGVAA